MEAERLEVAFALLPGGAVAGRVAPVRPRAAGVAASHPELVAGLLRALDVES